MTNLPPGVSDSMIPGNRPEDLLADRISEALSGLVADFGVTYDESQDDEYGEILDALVSFVQRYRTEVE